MFFCFVCSTLLSLFMVFVIMSCALFFGTSISLSPMLVCNPIFSTFVHTFVLSLHIQSSRAPSPLFIPCRSSVFYLDSPHDHAGLVSWVGSSESILYFMLVICSFFAWDWIVNSANMHFQSHPPPPLQGTTAILNMDAPTWLPRRCFYVIYKPSSLRPGIYLRGAAYSQVRHLERNPNRLARPATSLLEFLLPFFLGGPQYHPSYLLFSKATLRGILLLKTFHGNLTGPVG
jgi:hypothetical protein